jgi:hypothetical protein
LNEIAKNNGYTLIRYELNTVKDVKPCILKYYDELLEILKLKEKNEYFKQ